MLIIIKNCEKLNYNELKQDLKKTSNHREYQILKLKIKLKYYLIKKNLTNGIEIYDFCLILKFQGCK